MLYDDRFSLTLDEVVHMRSVLTRAEIESLPTDGKIKEDVQKCKVCFLCLKSRFRLFGPWGQCCKLCKRTVCIKCYSKINIPANKFSEIPVILLSTGFIVSPSTKNFHSKIYKKMYEKKNFSVYTKPSLPATEVEICKASNKFSINDLNKKDNITSEMSAQNINPQYCPEER